MRKPKRTQWFSLPPQLTPALQEKQLCLPRRAGTASWAGTRDWRRAQRDKARHRPGAGICLGGPRRPASLWVPSCARVGLVCVRLEVSTEQMLPAWCGLAQPASTSPPLAPDAQGGKAPLCLPAQRAHPSPALHDLSVRASGACMDCRTSGQTDEQLHLPSFLSPLLSPGIQCGGLSSLRWSLSPLHGARRGLQQ